MAELTASGQAPLFIFYYSGHGDAGALHLRGEAMPLDELRAELERVPARLRLVIIDACRTVAADVATPSLVGIAHSLAAQAAIGMRLVRARLSCSMQLGAELRGTFERLSQRDAARRRGRLPNRSLARWARRRPATRALRRHRTWPPAHRIAVGIGVLLLRNEHDELGRTQLAMRI